MKSICLILTVVLACLAQPSHADPGSFSQTELDAMGLSSIRVISDHEASAVRVYGSYPSRWGNAYPWLRGVNRLEQRDIRFQRPFYPLQTSAIFRMRYSRLP